MGFGHRPRSNRFGLSPGEFDDAVNEIVKRVRVDRTHDVPYTGSCNRGGDVIYIDHELPRTLTYRGREFDVDRYLVLHEVIEMLLEHELRLEYQFAHQIALRAERALVESDGLSWAAYNRFCTKWTLRIARRAHYPNPPKDIDLQPERDMHDGATLKRMALAPRARRPRRAR